MINSGIMIATDCIYILFILSETAALRVAGAAIVCKKPSNIHGMCCPVWEVHRNDSCW